MKVLLVGGVKDAKVKKFTESIQKNCGKDVEVAFANTFTSKPEEVYASENPDVIVMLNKQSFDFGDTPIIDGLGLVYPQMGEKKVYKKINEYK